MRSYSEATVQNVNRLYVYIFRIPNNDEKLGFVVKISQARSEADSAAILFIVHKSCMFCFDTNHEYKCLISFYFSLYCLQINQY